VFAPSIPQPLRDKVERELETDERIEWIATPQRVFFTPGATAAFLFGIPWTAFALFWIAGAAGFKIPQFNQGWDMFPLFEWNTVSRCSPNDITHHIPNRNSQPRRTSLRPTDSFPLPLRLRALP